MWRVVSRIVAGLITLAVVVLVVALVANLVLERHEIEKRRHDKTFVAATHVRQSDFVVYFDQIGTLEAEKSIPVASEVDGQIVWVVPNGVRVKKNALIMALDTPRMERDLRRASSEYYTAEDELDRTTKEREAEVKAAEVTRQEAEAALEQFEHEVKVDLDARRAQIGFDKSALERERDRLDRLRRLAEQGLMTRREVESAESEIKSKEFAIEKQIKDLGLAEAKAESDKLEKQAALDRAAAEVGRAQRRRDDEVKNGQDKLNVLKRRVDRAAETLAKAEIYAPADGIVVLDMTWEGSRRRPLQAGDHVWPTRRIARIPVLSVMRVHMALPQERVSDVKVGQKAEVRLDALPGQIFRGEIGEVASTAVEESTGLWMAMGERTFRAYVALDKPDAKELKPGMRANVRIIVDYYKLVVNVPLECVFEREADKKVVYVRRGGKFREAPVVVGRANQDRVIITEGLKPGEAVALRDLGSATAGEAEVGTDESTPTPSL